MRDFFCNPLLPSPLKKQRPPPPQSRAPALCSISGVPCNRGYGWMKEPVGPGNGVAFMEAVEVRLGHVPCISGSTNGASLAPQG